MDFYDVLFAKSLGGEGGGGSGELSNPKLTINVTAQGVMGPSDQLGLLDGNIGWDALYYKNNKLIDYSLDALPEDGVVYLSNDGRNKTVTNYIINSRTDGNYYWNYENTFLFNIHNATLTNMVNCSGNYTNVTITDPSQDASFDILIELVD